MVGELRDEVPMLVAEVGVRRMQDARAFSLGWVRHNGLEPRFSSEQHDNRQSCTET